MNMKILAIAVVCAMLVCPLALSDADADTGFDVIDGDGNQFHFDGASDHIVTTGYATTHTFQQLGALDKIVATDYYGSKDYAVQNFGDDTLSDLNALNLGSIFSKDIVDSFKAELPKLVEQGKLDFDDAIILTTSSKIYDIKAELEGLGFTHVLLYKSIDSFDGIVDMMKTLSIVATGSIVDRVTQMSETRDLVSSTTANAEPAKALFVWHNSSGVSVGNTGIMSSMLGICHAKQLGLDTSVEKGYYGDETTIVQLLDGNTDAVVFVNYSYFLSGDTVADFRAKYLGGDENIKIVKMESLWNNYCFESADALKTIAGYLYPELFDGDDAQDDEGKNSSNTVIYIAMGAIAVVAIAAVALYVMKRP